MASNSNESYFINCHWTEQIGLFAAGNLFVSMLSSIYGMGLIWIGSIILSDNIYIYSIATEMLLANGALAGALATPLVFLCFNLLVLIYYGLTGNATNNYEPFLVSFLWNVRSLFYIAGCVLASLILAQPILPMLGFMVFGMLFELIFSFVGNQNIMTPQNFFTPA